MMQHLLPAFGIIAALTAISWLPYAELSLTSLLTLLIAIGVTFGGWLTLSYLTPKIPKPRCPDCGTRMKYYRGYERGLLHKERQAAGVRDTSKVWAWNEAAGMYWCPRCDCLYDRLNGKWLRVTEYMTKDRYYPACSFVESSYLSRLLRDYGLRKEH